MMVQFPSKVAIPLVVFWFSVSRVLADRRLGEDSSGAGPARILEDKLEKIGDDGVPNTTFPLLKCKGDCDTYDECAADLRCYHRRYAEDDGPPGCHGEIMDGTDFCFDPDDDPKIPPLGTLVRLAQDGDPSWAFPLRKCQGDCDGDEDCLKGLKCFKRKVGNESDIGPPGCSGDAIGTADFCYDPNDPIDPIDPIDDTDVETNVETKTVDDEEVPSNVESESSSRSKGAKLMISFVVLGVTALLIVAFWFYKRTAMRGSTMAQTGAEIRSGRTPLYKEQETESDEEPTTLTS